VLEESTEVQEEPLVTTLSLTILATAQNPNFFVETQRKLLHVLHKHPKILLNAKPHKQEPRIHSVSAYILYEVTETNKQTRGVQMKFRLERLETCYPLLCKQITCSVFRNGSFFQLFYKYSQSLSKKYLFVNLVFKLI